VSNKNESATVAKKTKILRTKQGLRFGSPFLFAGQIQECFFCPLSIVTVISDDLMLLLTSVCLGYLLEGIFDRVPFHGCSFLSIIMQFWSYICRI
jgi:hypothetical protein